MKCYNGCWDSKTQKMFDYQDSLVEELKKLNPAARCTYFPMEQKYLIFIGFHSIGKMHTDKTTALQEAIKLLKEE